MTVVSGIARAKDIASTVRVQFKFYLFNVFLSFNLIFYLRIMAMNYSFGPPLLE